MPHFSFLVIVEFFIISVLRLNAGIDLVKI